MELSRQRRGRSAPIPEFIFAAFASTISAAENSATACLDTVSNNLAPAVFALRSHYLNGAFETVENVGFAARSDLERLIVIVTAQLTPSHTSLFRAARGRRVSLSKSDA